MTQLIINGIEAVLPRNFTTTVKRENSFFTKSGEYTYDCTLNLDNPVNCQLFEFLNRLNKTEQVETRRTATLIADGHVYTRGTEIITRWTEDTVTIQIVSGESELNYFIGQDQKIEKLNLGEATEENCCYPVVRTQSGEILNRYSFARDLSAGSGSSYGAGAGQGESIVYANENPVAQPYLCTLVDAIIKTLGYNKGEEGVNQLRDTQFKDLFIVNTLHTTSLAEMLTGWTVKDFMTEVEKLTGCVFVTDNQKKTCSVLLKNQYYQEARMLTVRNVVDAYETEVQDEEGREAEFSTSDVSYDLPNHRWANLMKLPEDMRNTAIYKNYDNLTSVIEAMRQSAQDTKDRAIYRDTSTGRCYIRATRSWDKIAFGGQESEETYSDYFILEVDEFRNLDREDSQSTLDIKITPAPMMWLKRFNHEVIDLGSSDGYATWWKDGGTEEDEGEEEEADFEDLIREFTPEDSSAIDLYCAFCKKDESRPNFHLAYTDAYHAQIQGELYQVPAFTPPGDLAGSLRLQDLDEGYFQGAYEVDTRHAVTIETYDPNVIDPRQVYVIRNKRFVCRDAEEVITAEGRQPKWKGTFFPIHVSDESLEHKWVLTHGVWDDHAAWLDDGRWIDDYDGLPV